MTKGETRKQRKAARANGQPWNVELGDQGQLEQVPIRTTAQERAHERRMERWIKAGGGGDFDYSMNG